MLASNRRKLLIAMCLLITAIILSFYAHRTPYSPAELNLTLFVQSFDSQPFDSLMKVLSYVFTGWRAALMVALTVALFWRYYGNLEGIIIGVAGLLSLLDAPLKVLIGRPRPSAELVQVYTVYTNNSFPSGHSLLAMLFLSTLIYFALTSLKRRMWRILAVTILTASILLVGVSRIYLGAHWLSDVIGGYLIGGVLLNILISFYETTRSRQTIANIQ